MFFSFKYDPKVLNSILFPHPQPSKKHRRTDDTDEQAMDVDADVDLEAQPGTSESVERTREIVLETPTGRFLLSPSPINEEGNECDGAKSINSAPKYMISRIVEGGPILPDLTGNDEGQPPTPPKPVEPPADVKPPPPTWSTPPTESDHAPIVGSIIGQSSTVTKQSDSKAKAPTKPARAKPSAQVLLNDRGQEHFRFSIDGLSIEGLVGTGLLESDGIVVRRWRWASPEEFVAS